MKSRNKPTSLQEISFPVYRLGLDTPVVENNVILYITRTKDEDSNEITEVFSVIDDKNVPGETLAVRRLRLRAAGVKLKRLTRAVFFFGDLIKIATSKTWFIDAKGHLFQYSKKIRVNLIFKKITKIIPIPSGGALLELEGLANRFKCLYTPKPEERYAGVLKYGMSYILYGVFTERYDNTWRLI